MKIEEVIKNELNKIEVSPAIDISKYENELIEISTDSFQSIIDKLFLGTKVYFSHLFDHQDKEKAYCGDFILPKKNIYKKEEIKPLIEYNLTKLDSNNNYIFSTLSDEILDQKLLALSKLKYVNLSLLVLIYQRKNERQLSKAPLIYFKIKVVNTNEGFYIELLDKNPIFNEGLTKKLIADEKIDISFKSDIDFISYTNRISKLIANKNWAVDISIFLSKFDYENLNDIMNTFSSNFSLTIPLMAVNKTIFGNEKLNNLPYYSNSCSNNVFKLFNKYNCLEIKNNNDYLVKQLLEDIKYSSLISNQKVAIYNGFTNSKLLNSRLEISGEELFNVSDHFLYRKLYEQIDVINLEENKTFLSEYENKLKQYFSKSSYVGYKNFMGENIKQLIDGFVMYRKSANNKINVDFALINKDRFEKDIKTIEDIEKLDNTISSPLNNNPYISFIATSNLFDYTNTVKEFIKLLQDNNNFINNYKDILPPLSSISEQDEFIKLLTFLFNAEYLNPYLLSEENIEDLSLRTFNIIKLFEYKQLLSQRILSVSDELIFDFANENFVKRYKDKTLSKDELKRFRSFVKGKKKTNEEFVISNLIHYVEATNKLINDRNLFPNYITETTYEQFVDLNKQIAYFIKLRKLLSSASLPTIEFVKKIVEDKDFSFMVRNKIYGSINDFTGRFHSMLKKIDTFYYVDKHFINFSFTKLVNYLSLAITKSYLLNEYVSLEHRYNECSKCLRTIINKINEGNGILVGLKDTYYFSYYLFELNKFFTNFKSELKEDKQLNNFVLQNYDMYVEVVKDTIIEKLIKERKQYIQTENYCKELKNIKEDVQDNIRFGNSQTINKYFSSLLQLSPIVHLYKQNLAKINGCQFNILVVFNSEELTDIQLIELLSLAKSVIVINKLIDSRLGNYQKSEIKFDDVIDLNKFSMIESNAINYILGKGFKLTNLYFNKDKINNVMCIDGKPQLLPVFSLNFGVENPALFYLQFNSLAKYYHLKMLLLDELKIFNSSENTASYIDDVLKENDYCGTFVYKDLEIKNGNLKRLVQNINLERKYYYFRNSLIALPQIKNFKNNENILFKLLPLDDETLKKYHLLSAAKKALKAGKVTFKDGFYFYQNVIFRKSDQAIRGVNNISKEEIKSFIEQFMKIFKTANKMMIVNELFFELQIKQEEDKKISYFIDEIIDEMIEEKKIVNENNLFIFIKE